MHAFFLLIITTAAFYIVRAVWIARREWSALDWESKALYLAVAPPLTLGVDLLQMADIFFGPRTDEFRDRTDNSRLQARQRLQDKKRNAVSVHQPQLPSAIR